MAPAFPPPVPKPPVIVARCTKLSIMQINPSTSAAMDEDRPLPALLAERLLDRQPMIKLIRPSTPPTRDLARPVVMPVGTGEVPSGFAAMLLAVSVLFPF